MAPPSNRNAIFDRARRHVELQLKQAEDEHRRNLLKKRLEFITNGVKASQEKKLIEAVRNYQSYIKLLEDWKGVGEGGLTPTNFDFTKEMGDLLMLSGIYWDLTRFFDLTESPERQKDFFHYLEKFILFSKGTSWQPLCAETLRRYIRGEKPKHREAFKNAYKVLGDGKCFIVTALIEETDLDTLPILWRFRDEILASTGGGRLFIRVYYRTGPWAASGIAKLPAFLRKAIACRIDILARWIEKSLLQ